MRGVAGSVSGLPAGRDETASSVRSGTVSAAVVSCFSSAVGCVSGLADSAAGDSIGAAAIFGMAGACGLLSTSKTARPPSRPRITTPATAMRDSSRFRSALSSAGSSVAMAGIVSDAGFVSISSGVVDFSVISVCAIVFSFIKNAFATAEGVHQFSLGQ